MPAVPKCRRVIKSRVLVKKTQLKQKSCSSNSRNLWYEKFRATKANNNALARALSKEKQDSQYLFTQNVELTRQLQDIEVLVHNRDDVLSGILKNSSEALKLLVQATNCITSTIVACQTIVGSKSQSINLRSSTSMNASNPARRESMRRSTGKSPARGVVQPMVSGHTITKPVINLSRINMPRVRTSPNLSVIDESIDGGGGTPERNPILNETHTPHRIPVSRLNGITNRRVDGLLPERIRLTSPRLSEENEQMSNVQNRRLSNRLSHINRNSRRISRKSDPQQSSSIESSLINDDLQITIKSPRVTLQDVSRLLQNSQSINIRTLMESSELLVGQENENRRDRTAPNDNDNNIIISETQDDEIIDKDLLANSNESEDSSPTYNFDPRKKKSKRNSNSRTEDPLEGPSWLYNPIQSTDSSGQNEILQVSNASESPRSNKSGSGHVTKSLRWSERQLSKLNSTNMTNSTNESSTSSRTGWGETYCNDTRININDNEENGSDSDRAVNINDNEEDSDKCENLTNIVGSFNTKKNKSELLVRDRLMQTSTNVTCHRGHNEIDDDDFTMVFSHDPKQQTRNMDFDINELNLPVLERPLTNSVDVEPEPEITTTINMITQAYQPMPSMARENMDASLMENNNTVLIPIIRDSIFPASSDLDLTIPKINVNDESEDTTSVFLNDPRMRKRKRLIRNRIDSSSDSEPSLTPEKISTVRRKNIRRKDPSAAKVVLEKLEESNCKKTLSSLNSGHSLNNFSINSAQSDAQSDSEGSNASSMMSSGRPRRQKAPINLKEPKLGTKLRR